MKLNCEQISSLLKSDYLDNEQKSAAREQVNSHLEVCPACQRTREGMNTVSLLLRNTPRIPPPQDLWTRIQAEIQAERVPRVSRSITVSAARFKYFFAWRNTFALAAAAMLVVTIVGFYFWSLRPDNGELGSSLTALAGSEEIRDPDMNFGSAIEKYFL